MKSGEAVHLLVFLLVCLLALGRSDIKDSQFKERVLVEFEGGLYVEEDGIRGRAKILDAERKQLIGRRAWVRLYGVRDLPPGALLIDSKVKISKGRVYITSSYKNVRGVILKSSLRERLMQRYVSKTDSRELSGVGLAFLFGESRAVLTERVKGAFSSTGLAHLLVVSGLHVGTIALILFKLLPFPYGAWLSMAGVSLYVFLIVPHNPPVLRAYLMAMLLLLSLLTFRRANSVSVLFFSGSLILTLYPGYVASYSFWLSFFATLYILLSLQDSRPEGLLKGSLKVSLAAFTGVSPLLSTFGNVSPLSVLLTPLLSPLVFVYSSLGMLCLVSGFLLSPLVELFNLAGELFLLSVEWFNRISFSLYPELHPYEAVALSLAGAVGIKALRDSYTPHIFVLAWLALRAIL